MLINFELYRHFKVKLTLHGTGLSDSEKLIWKGSIIFFPFHSSGILWECVWRLGGCRSWWKLEVFFSTWGVGEWCWYVLSWGRWWKNSPYFLFIMRTSINRYKIIKKCKNIVQYSIFNIGNKVNVTRNIFWYLVKSVFLSSLYNILWTILLIPHQYPSHLLIIYTRTYTRLFETGVPWSPPNLVSDLPHLIGIFVFHLYNFSLLKIIRLYK